MFPAEATGCCIPPAGFARMLFPGDRGFLLASGGGRLFNQEPPGIVLVRLETVMPDDLHMDPEDFRELGRKLIDFIADYREKIETLPVL